DHKSSSSQKGNGTNSSSQKGNGPISSKGSPPTPGGTSTKNPGKQTRQQTGDHNEMHLPKNANLPDRKLPKGIHPHPLRGIANNPRGPPAAQGALNSVLAGNILDANGRQELNNLLAGNPAGLNEDELKSVQEVLDFDALLKREERYLQVEN